MALVFAAFFSLPGRTSPGWAIEVRSFMTFTGGESTLIAPDSRCCGSNRSPAASNTEPSCGIRRGEARDRATTRLRRKAARLRIALTGGGGLELCDIAPMPTNQAHRQRRLVGRRQRLQNKVRLEVRERGQLQRVGHRIGYRGGGLCVGHEAGVDRVPRGVHAPGLVPLCAATLGC